MKVRIYACLGSLTINVLLLTVLLGASSTAQTTQEPKTQLSATTFKTNGPSLTTHTRTNKPATDSLTRSITPQVKVAPLQTSFNAQPIRQSLNRVLNLSHEAQGRLAYKESAVDHAPLILARTPPKYPLSAKEQGIEGYVEYKIRINTQGEVDAFWAIAAQPAGYFEESCQKALKQFKFRPAQKNGQSVPVMIKQKFTFNLEE
ncbi:MAG: energy transducer TonB [Myxococcota bacterium]|jgi:protein TonB|nr:energy transducer TonB [Myxococcota bacterium]